MLAQYTKEFKYNSIQDLNGLRVATSYPKTVTDYCSSKGITVDIHQISGSVEIAPNIGLSDAIVDIVSSGSTLFKNGLKEVEVILKSEAVLAVSPQISSESKALLSKLQFRIQSVLRSKKSKYILMNVPNDKIDLSLNNNNAVIIGASWNEENASFMQKYMKDKFQFYGIKAPERKQVLKEIKSLFPKEFSEDFISLSFACFEKQEREWHQFGVDCLLQNKKN